MKLEQLIDSEGLTLAMEDHSGEEYEIDGDTLTIHFSGRYTLAEMEYKTRLLNEAISLYFVYGKE